MPFEARGAIDSLSRTREWLASLKQRRKEANQAMFSDLAGKGLDIWKTIQGQKLAREMPGIEQGERVKAEMELGEFQHLLDIDTLHEQAGIADEARSQEAEDALRTLDAEYRNRMQLLIREGAQQSAIENERFQYEQSLQAWRQQWETGEREAAVEDEKELIAARGVEDREAIRLSYKVKGTDPQNITLWKDLLESAYQQGQLNGIVTVDELGQERVDRARAGDFRAILEAGLPSGDAILRGDLQKRIDAFINSLSTVQTADEAGLDRTLDVGRTPQGAPVAGITAAEQPMYTQLKAALQNIQTQLKSVPSASPAPFGLGNIIPSQIGVGGTAKPYGVSGMVIDPEAQELQEALQALQKPGEVSGVDLRKIQELLKRLAPPVSKTRTGELLGLPEGMF